VRTSIFTQRVPGLDARVGDQLDLGRMRHNRAADQSDQQVVDRPGIGRGFDHNGIRALEIGLRPGGPARELEAAGREDNPFVGINASNHEIVFVDVDGDVAGPGLKRRVSHATLLVSGR
jgi:hypothetical protein